MSGAPDDPLLGIPLPRGDAATVIRTASELRDVATRLVVLARGVAGLFPVVAWSGVAAAAADLRLVDVAVGLGRERTRLVEAVEALAVFAGRLAAAHALAEEARALLASAYRLQTAADARDPALAVARGAGSWAGHRVDGPLYDPAAVALLRRARASADESRDIADSASRRLVSEVTALSGRTIVRDQGSWRTLLDLAGFIPRYGDYADLANAGIYAAQGDLKNALLTGAAAVPGPFGWIAGTHKVDQANGRIGDVVEVVDDLPAQQRALDALSGLTVHGRRRDVRLLPDGHAVDRFYRDVLSRLGPTSTRLTARGTLSITELPGGARIIHRSYSGTGGPAIELQGPEGLILLIHVAPGGGT